MIVLDSSDRVISQSIEKALDKLIPEDKEGFLKLLKVKYKFDFRYASKTFYTFYLALKETYPLKHYLIESEIIKAMHEDTIKGIYNLPEEIDAFMIITTVIQEDEKRTINQIKKRLDTIDEKREMIQRELSDKQIRIDRLNQYFSEIDVNLRERKENSLAKKGENH